MALYVEHQALSPTLSSSELGVLAVEILRNFADAMLLEKMVNPSATDNFRQTVFASCGIVPTSTTIPCTGTCSITVRLGVRSTFASLPVTQPKPFMFLTTAFVDTPATVSLPLV